MPCLRIAALPMYDFPELRADTDALWSAIAAHLNSAGVTAVPQYLSRGRTHVETWRDPALLLGQGCEFPLAKSFSTHIRLVATPRYTAPGCEGNHYRSVVIVRTTDPARTLEDLRGRRCAVNEASSNSGMNLLRAAIAPLAAGSPFFGEVVCSGSHRQSIDLVGAGAADVAAIDCVSFALVQRVAPSLVGRVRVLDRTATSPSLPYITSRTTSSAVLDSLRSSLAAVSADPALAAVRSNLLLDGFNVTPDESFADVLELETGAVRAGYPILQ